MISVQRQTLKRSLTRARRVMPLVSVSKRGRVGRRLAEIEAQFIEAMGGEAALSPVQRERASTAAQLAVAAELARDRFLNGDGTITADDLVRMGNQARIAENRLQLPEKKPEAAPVLHDYLRQLEQETPA